MNINTQLSEKLATLVTNPVTPTPATPAKAPVKRPVPTAAKAKGKSKGKAKRAKNADRKPSANVSIKFVDAKKDRLRVTMGPLDDAKTTWEVYVKHSPAKGKGQIGMRFPLPTEKPMNEAGAKSKFDELVGLAERNNWKRTSSKGGGERASSFSAMPKAAVA